MTQPGPTSQAGSAPRSWTVLELLRWTTQHFDAKGIATARLDAECLLAHALGVERLRLYLDFDKPISTEERSRFRELVRRRAGDRVPVSQLIGVREFWSLPLRVSSQVLTPRPETELLVTTALEQLSDPSGEYHILDLGTGAGPIALAIASERPQARLVATDISQSALQMAQVNADELHLSDAVRFLEGSLFEPIEGEVFDAVVTNPPYVARRDRAGLPPELAHEPEEALFGGEDGLELVRELVAAVPEYLAPGGIFLVEIDPDQAEEVARQCRDVGLREVEILLDLARCQRAVIGRR